VPDCCDSRWALDCSTLDPCPNLVPSSSLMRIQLYENSSSSVPASSPIDTQNLWVELMWDWDESSKSNITTDNATLAVEYLPTTTWLVLAFGSSIHPAVWLNVSASLGFIDSNEIITPHTIIATYAQGSQRRVLPLRSLNLGFDTTFFDFICRL
jgi:hypothetical protein